MTNLSRRPLRKLKYRRSAESSGHNGSTPRSGWDEVREWSMVGATVGSLLVAVVAFWTTARISGLEDYLKSEIRRRNSELNDISAQSVSLRRMADSSSDRLAKLQTDTDSLITLSLTAQRRYLDAQSELSGVRNEVVSAKFMLAETQIRQRIASEALGRQVKQFDLSNRRHAFQIATVSLYSRLAYGRNLLDRATAGTELISAVHELRSPKGDENLAPYYKMIRDNFESICPTVKPFKPEIPPLMADPVFPPDATSRRTSQRDVVVDYNKRMDTYNKALAEYQVASDAHYKAKREALEKLLGFVEPCTCKALVGSGAYQTDICPNLNE